MRDAAAEWRDRCARLGRSAEAPGLIRLFSVAYPMYPLYGSSAGGDTGARRHLQLSLYAPDILATPQPLAAKLTARGFAIWTSDNDKRWAASTRWDTISFETGATVAVDWIDLLPAKGAGFAGLEIGRWGVRSGQGSTEIAEAARLLATFRGVAVAHHQGYDC